MIINFLLPHYGIKPSGGFKIVYEYANRLSEKGHTINIVHSSSLNKGIKRQVKYLKEILIKKYSFNEWFKFNKEVNLLFCKSLDYKYIPDADITIATAWQTAEYLKEYPVSKGEKIYFIQSYEIWNGPKKRVDRTWLYDMDKIVISKSLLKISKDLNIKNNIKYIPNAIDHEKYRMIKSFDKRELVISMMYSEVKNKGSIYGLKAINEVKEIVPEIKVKFFGKCSRPKDLPKWIEYYEDPKEEVLIKEIYNESLIFLCTSFIEGWGLPAMEAMACRCVVISTDNGGVSDFAIDDRTALIVPVGDYIEIKNKILYLVKNIDIMNRLSYEGQKEVLKFNWNTSVGLMEDFLKNRVYIRSRDDKYNNS